MTRIAAADAYSRSPLRAAALPLLIEVMGHDYPLVRVVTRTVVERLIGRRLSAAEYDIDAPACVRSEQLARIFEDFQAKSVQ